MEMKKNFLTKLRTFNKKISFKSHKIFVGRLYFLAFIYIFIFLIVLFKFAWLSFIPNPLRKKLILQVEKQLETEIKVTKYRGTISDRNGRILAMSVPRKSVFILPRKIPKSKKEKKALAKDLNVSFKDIQNLSHSKNNYVWLKRKINDSEFKKITNLKRWRQCVGVLAESLRVYPEKRLAAHLVGFVSRDNVGLEGVEKIYDDILQEDVQKIKVIRDARGNSAIMQPVEGQLLHSENRNIQLSIDSFIQEFTERELEGAIKKTKSKGGSAVVLNVKNGEVLAIASYPNYDLNSPPLSNPDKMRFRAIMDALELGSVVKPIFIARALDKGVIKVNEEIWCENSYLKLKGGSIRDDVAGNKWLTASDIIRKSSNIGMYKVCQKLGKEELFNTIKKVGLNRFSGTGLPGEWDGNLSPPSRWKELRFSNLSFGQGMAISNLQLAHAMSIIVDNGIDKGISILKQKKDKEEELGPKLQIISSETSKIIREMMGNVVYGGAGRRAKIRGILVGGKTGTAQKFNFEKHSYSDRILSFIGVLPIEKPNYLISIVLDESQASNNYGGVHAAPVFAKIGENLINYFNAKGIIALDEKL